MYAKGTNEISSGTIVVVPLSGKLVLILLMLPEWETLSKHSSDETISCYHINRISFHVSQSIFACLQSSLLPLIWMQVEVWQEQWVSLVADSVPVSSSSQLSHIVCFVFVRECMRVCVWRAWGYVEFEWRWRGEGTKTPSGMRENEGTEREKWDSRAREWSCCRVKVSWLCDDAFFSRFLEEAPGDSRIE